MAIKIHFRRCHSCGEVMEACGTLVDKCSHCGKSLQPFYYFDEKLIMGLKTPEDAAKEYKSSALPLQSYPPLWGLTAYWDVESS